MNPFLQKVYSVSAFNFEEIKKRKEIQKTQQKAMLRKCHYLVKVLSESGCPDDPHAVLKTYAEAVINYRGSLSEISHEKLSRLCTSLERLAKKNHPSISRDFFFIDNEPQANAAANAGKLKSKIDGIARAEDLVLIQMYADKLGWNRNRLEGWIRKVLKKQLTLTEIKTQSQVNRILWPMKKMLRNGCGRDRYA